LYLFSSRAFLAYGQGAQLPSAGCGTSTKLINQDSMSAFTSSITKTVVQSFLQSQDCL